MRRQTILALAIATLLPGAAFAQSPLDRPDPGIGAGFANAMAEKFMTDHGLSRAAADCLVYEVVEEGRRISYSKDLDTLGRELLHLCEE